MNKSKFSVIPEFLTEAQCDHICELAMELDNIEPGKMLDDAGYGHLDARKCKISWLDHATAEKKGLGDEVENIYNYIDVQVNSVVEGMGLSDWVITERESFQYTQYEPGDGYGWHKDVYDAPYEEGHFKGLVRKISGIVFLNDFDEWDGGDLQLENNWEWAPDQFWMRMNAFHPTINEEIKKGSAIIFQSDLWHRVTPITRGIRKSLVLWYDGPPFV